MSQERKRVVVLGAGVTGLSAAYRLSQSGAFDIEVIDRESTVGGVCRSFTEGEYTLDHGPHKFYTLIDGILSELQKLMGDELLEREKTQSLYMCGKYFTFPLKMSEMLTRFPPSKSTKVLLSYAMQMVRNFLPHPTAKTYEEFIIERFGAGLYHQIFEPMAKKIFGSPDTLDRKLAEVRISSPGLISVIKQLLFRSKIDRTISAPTFHYPKQGYGRIPVRLQEQSQKQGVQFHLGAKILNIEIQNSRVASVTIQTSQGATQRIPCDYLIYSIPLSALADLIPKEIPAQIRRVCRFVTYRHTVIYYFLLRSQPILPSMWVFFPEEQFRFGRLSEMIKFSPYTAPKGHTALMVDFTCEDSDPAWSMDDGTLGQLLLKQLEPLKLFTADKIVKQFSKRFRNFYPIYSVGYEENLRAIRQLETLFDNLFFIGRLGDFNYNNADQCLDMGFIVADHIRTSGTVAQGWQNIREKRFENYRIVD